MRKSIRFGLLLTGVLAVAHHAIAMTEVSDCDELKSAVENARSGEKIVVQKNTYSCGEQIIIPSDQGHITIEAEDRHEAVFANQTRLKIDGDHITVKGFEFNESGIVICGNHNQVTENRFVDQFELEAEVVARNRDHVGELSGNMLARSDPEASGDQFISDAVGGGSATYNLHIPNAGEHNIWMRVQSLGRRANSFRVGVTDQGERVFRISPATSDGYIWRRARNVDLNAGEVDIVVSTDDRNTRLDQIIVTDNLQFVPNTSIEAEDGRLIAPMQVRADPEASGEAYISDDMGDGEAAYTVDIPRADAYDIWMRVQSLGGGANSFHVEVAGDEQVFHISPSTSDGYIWRRARRGVELAFGDTDIVVRTRETNTRLDEILVTNNPDFDPNLDLDAAIHVMGECR